MSSAIREPASSLTRTDFNEFNLIPESGRRKDGGRTSEEEQLISFYFNMCYAFCNLPLESE